MTTALRQCIRAEIMAQLARLRGDPEQDDDWADEAVRLWDSLSAEEQMFMRNRQVSASPLDVIQWGVEALSQEHQGRTT